MVAAIVLAAGMSRRYAGTNKLLLPFGTGTVISTTVSSVVRSAARPVVVITGHEAERVERALTERALTESALDNRSPAPSPVPLAFVHNPEYQTGEMLSSIKAGIRSLMPGPADAALIVLGDQPLVRPDVIERLRVAFERGCGDLIAPRFGIDGQRGHPVLIGRRWWDEVLVLPADGNVRDLLRAHRTCLTHLVVNSDSILGDVDTPEAYREALARAG